MQLCWLSGGGDLVKIKDALWVKVVSRKYDLGEDEWLPKNPNGGQPSNIWKDICSVGNSSNGMGDLQAQGFNIKVYSGRNVKFWDHKWIGEEPLKNQFSRLYNLSTQKNGMVVKFLVICSLEEFHLVGRRSIIS